MFFRLLDEHQIWFFKNKKSLEEGFKVEKKAKKAVEKVKKVVEKKAAKENELAMGLKKQLQKPLDSIKEKNKQFLTINV